jgi:hypothetical protein
MVFCLPFPTSLISLFKLNPTPAKSTFLDLQSDAGSIKSSKIYPTSKDKLVKNANYILSPRGERFAVQGEVLAAEMKGKGPDPVSVQ